MEMANSATAAPSLMLPWLGLQSEPTGARPLVCTSLQHTLFGQKDAREDPLGLALVADPSGLYRYRSYLRPISLDPLEA